MVVCAPAADGAPLYLGFRVPIVLLADFYLKLIEQLVANRKGSRSMRTDIGQ